MSGSLYVETTVGAPHSTASRERPSAVTSRGAATASGSRTDCDVNQFWQYAQCRSQPSIPNESASEPGRAWKKGFFSIGSHWIAPT